MEVYSKTEVSHDNETHTSDKRPDLVCLVCILTFLDHHNDYAVTFHCWVTYT